MSTPQSMICKGCWQHMHMPIPIRGPLSIPFKLFGIKISQMHPNLCTICETMFTRVKRKKQLIIPATVFFADLRGIYESLPRNGDGEVLGMLHDFYDTCASAVWGREGIVKVHRGCCTGYFQFSHHARGSCPTGRSGGVELQRRCSEKKRVMITNADGKARPVGVGIGIHTGHASIGEVGTAYKDFTIIGSVVNMASRIQGPLNQGKSSSRKKSTQRWQTFAQDLKAAHTN